MMKEQQDLVGKLDHRLGIRTTSVIKKGSVLMSAMLVYVRHFGFLLLLSYCWDGERKA